MQTESHMNGYLALILDEQSQAKLLETFPPKHPKVFAHHVTVQYKPTLAEYDAWKEYLGSDVILSVYGYAEDEKGQTVLVDTDMFKNQEREYHITISTNNMPPVYSLELLKKGFRKLDDPIMLTAKFEFINH